MGRDLALESDQQGGDGLGELVGGFRLGAELAPQAAGEGVECGLERAGQALAVPAWVRWGRGLFVVFEGCRVCVCVRGMRMEER
jgi:hypothetical protein